LCNALLDHYLRYSKGATGALLSSKPDPFRSAAPIAFKRSALWNGKGLTMDNIVHVVRVTCETNYYPVGLHVQ